MAFIIEKVVSTAVASVGDVEKPIIAVVGPNGGGSRKTTTSKMLASAAWALGHRVLFVCADPGIGGLTKSLRVGLYDVEDLPREESPTFGADILARAKELGATFIVIDLGANMMLQGAVTRTVRAALQHARAAGCSTFVILSLIPLKVGLAEDALFFGRRMAAAADPVLFFHGRERGADFTALDELKVDFPAAVELNDEFEATVGLMNDEQLTPFDFAVNAKPPFAKAAGQVARNLIAFATQPVIAEILGAAWTAPPALSKAAGLAPSHWYPVSVARWQITDDVLSARERVVMATHDLQRLSADCDDASLLAAARQWLIAWRAAYAADRAAQKAIG